MSNEKVKVFKLYDGEHCFYHEDVADLAQHIAQLCDIEEGDKIIIETMTVDRTELDAMPEADLEL